MNSTSKAYNSTKKKKKKRPQEEVALEDCHPNMKTLTTYYGYH